MLLSAAGRKQAKYSRFTEEETQIGKISCPRLYMYKGVKSEFECEAVCFRQYTLNLCAVLTSSKFFMVMGGQAKTRKHALAQCVPEMPSRST